MLLEFRTCAANRVAQVVKNVNGNSELKKPELVYYSCDKTKSGDGILEFTCPILGSKKALYWHNNHCVVTDAKFQCFHTLKFPDLFLLRAYFFYRDQDYSVLYLICARKTDGEIEIRVLEGTGDIFSMQFNQTDIQFFDGFTSLLFPEIPHVLRIARGEYPNVDKFTLKNFTQPDFASMQRIVDKIVSPHWQVSTDQWLSGVSNFETGLIPSKNRFLNWTHVMKTLGEDSFRMNYNFRKDLSPPDEFMNSTSPRMSLALAKFLILVSEMYSKDFTLCGIGAPIEWTHSHWQLIYIYLVNAPNSKELPAPNIGIEFFKEPFVCCQCQEKFDTEKCMMVARCGHMMCIECFESWIIKTIELDISELDTSIYDTLTMERTPGDNSKCPICKKCGFACRKVQFRKAVDIPKLPVIDKMDDKL